MKRRERERVDVAVAARMGKEVEHDMVVVASLGDVNVTEGE